MFCVTYCYVATVVEFHKLADEAENELREMEKMLSLLPSSPPASSTVPGCAAGTHSKAVDSSIASVMNEMSQIEGTHHTGIYHTCYDVHVTHSFCSCTLLYTMYIIIYNVPYIIQ